MDPADKIARAIREYNMFAPGEDVLVGFSGGADSVCCLHYLHEHAGELGVAVRAVHVHHGIRGAEADADAAFARAFCETRGIPFAVRCADVPGEAAAAGESTEACARRLRYAIFESEGADKTVTAHTASDAVETLLINLSRGAGLRGLCSIPPVRGRIVRPLIDLTREETERYCAENGLAYVTDSTNASELYARNRIRLQAIPALRAAYPAFEKNALRCIGILREDAAYLDSLSDGLFERAYNAKTAALAAQPLAGAPAPLLRRVIGRFLSEAGGAEFEEKHLRLLGSHLFDDAPFSVTLPGGKRAVAAQGVCRFAPAQAEQPAPSPVRLKKGESGAVAFGPFVLELRYLPAGDPALAGVPAGSLVDADKTGETVFVRGRQAGDKVTLIHRGCSKSLKKLYNERGYAAGLRASLPVLADEGGVIFAAACGAHAARLPDADTKNVLMIRFSDPERLLSDTDPADRRLQ